MLFVALLMMFDHIQSSDRKETENTSPAIIPTDVKIAIENAALEVFGTDQAVIEYIKKESEEKRLKTVYCRYLVCMLDYLYSIWCLTSFTKWMKISKSFTYDYKLKLKKLDEQLITSRLGTALAFFDIKTEFMNILDKCENKEKFKFYDAIDNIHPKLEKYINSLEKFDFNLFASNKIITSLSDELIREFMECRKNTDLQSENKIDEKIKKMTIYSWRGYELPDKCESLDMIVLATIGV